MASYAPCVQDERTVVTTADRQADVRLILYALELRGIRGEARPAPRGSPDRWEIVVSGVLAERAAAAMPHIWDAMVELPPAATVAGRCAFCAYDLAGVPDAPGRPLVCPECGVDLRSVGARRAFRDGRSFRPSPRSG